MVKVRCRVCGNIGYTACPKYSVCKCGGKFKIIPENGLRQKIELDEKTMELFDTSDLINQEIAFF